MMRSICATIRERQKSNFPKSGLKLSRGPQSKCLLTLIGWASNSALANLFLALEGTGSYDLSLLGRDTAA